MPVLRLGLSAAVALFALLLLLSCQRSTLPTPGKPESVGPASRAGPVRLGSPDLPAPSPGMPWFEDVTAASGIDFHHFDSTTPLDYIQERMGSGLGWIDYDND